MKLPDDDRHPDLETARPGAPGSPLVRNVTATDGFSLAGRMGGRINLTANRPIPLQYSVPPPQRCHTAAVCSYPAITSVSSFNWLERDATQQNCAHRTMLQMQRFAPRKGEELQLAES